MTKIYTSIAIILAVTLTTITIIIGVIYGSGGITDMLAIAKHAVPYIVTAATSVILTATANYIADNNGDDQSGTEYEG